METYEPHYMRGLLQNANRRAAMGHPLQSFFANEPARFSNLVVPMGLYCSNAEPPYQRECEHPIDTVGDTEHDELLNKVVIVVHNNNNNKQRSKKRNSFTPLRIENAQSVSSSSLITAPEGGVLNERRCKKKHATKKRNSKKRQ